VHCWSEDSLPKCGGVPGPPRRRREVEPVTKGLIAGRRGVYRFDTHLSVLVGSLPTHFAVRLSDRINAGDRATPRAARIAGTNRRSNLTAKQRAIL